MEMFFMKCLRRFIQAGLVNFVKTVFLCHYSALIPVHKALFFFFNNLPYETREHL